MRIQDIAQMPTDTKFLNNDNGIHESMLRGYQILQKVKEWLAEGVPSKVILQLVAEMEGSK